MTSSKVVPAAPAGESRPCVHRRVHHEHGTYNRAQLDGCRCGSCTKAIRRRRKQYRLGIKPAVSPLVPARRVAEHLAALREAGVSHRNVAERIGRSTSAVRRYAYLRDGRVRFESVKEILAIPVPSRPVPADGYVDAVGSRRRLQALAVMGWPLGVQAQRMGLSQAALTHIRMGRVLVVRARTAALIAGWYRYLLAHPPRPHERSTAADAIVRRVGANWVGPMAWGQGAIDDPSARPWDETDETTTGEPAAAGTRLGKGKAA